MPDPATNAEVLRSLGRLVRGLSALFWGLPSALVICIQTGRTEWLRTFGIVPPMVVTALLLYGLWQLGGFQKQERPWRKALDRARLLALINFGLSPFLYWWNRIPANGFFAIIVDVLALSSMLFLFDLNLVLQRLGAMLPDETLRHETRQFGALNRCLLAALLLLLALQLTLTRAPSIPSRLGFIAAWLEHSAFWILILLLVLLPLAMTMALIWKTKEVILDSVFGSEQ
jgi:hypothetical protein